MGNKQSIQKVNFEDIQNILLNSSKNVILINTLENNPEAQSCILPNTVHYTEEEAVINECLQKAKNIALVIYGKNSNDTSIYQKYTQLLDLGFTNVYVYPGGMFEWMLLQDIYSEEHFKMTQKELDILKFKPKSGMNIEGFSQTRF